MRSEFQFIRHIKERFNLSYVGDDCAVLPKDEFSDTLITADLLIEDVDFRLDWATPADIGHKSLAVSLSDVAAMGGTPRWAMLSIGVPEHLWTDSFLDELYESWHKLAEKLGVELVGGDVSSSADKLVVDSIVIGEVPKGAAMLRSSAKPGDSVYVSGSLGDAAAGLFLLESKSDDRDPLLIKKHLRPEPQVELGKRLQTLGIITSMIDLSDGLSSDLGHICEASCVGATIAAESIPTSPALRRSFPDIGRQLELALNGGEDYELLFTISPDSESAITELEVTRIGTITDMPGVLEITQNNNTRKLIPKGFQHFQS